MHPAGFAAPPDTKFSRSDTKIQHGSKPCDHRRNTYPESIAKPGRPYRRNVGLAIVSTNFILCRLTSFSQIDVATNNVVFSCHFARFSCPVDRRDPKGGMPSRLTAKVAPMVGKRMSYGRRNGDLQASETARHSSCEAARRSTGFSVSRRSRRTFAIPNIATERLNV